MSQQKLSGVPANKVEEMKNMFIAAGATKVESKKEDDGTFTLTATFPD